MGWYTTYIKNPAKKAGGFAKRNAAKAARSTAVIGAGIGGSLVPGCGPVCGALAAYAVEEWLGDPIERSTKRAIDRGAAEADDFVDYLRGGEEAPRPAGLAITVSGASVATTVRGDATEETSYRAPIALAAGAVTAASIALVYMQRTGRLNWS